MLFTLSLAETEKLAFIIISKSLKENKSFFEHAKLGLPDHKLFHEVNLTKDELNHNLNIISNTFPENTRLERLLYLTNQVKLIESQEKPILVYFDGFPKDIDEFVNLHNITTGFVLNENLE